MISVPSWNFEKMAKDAMAATLKSVSKPLRLNIQFFAVDPLLYSFGLADITVSKGDEVLNINGADYLQVDGGEVSLTPTFRPLNFKDFGDTNVQQRLSGWGGTVSFVVGQEDLKLMKLALSAVDEISSADATPVVVGYTDSKMGTILEGYKVVIHPRGLPASDKRFDITIYQMASTGGLTKPYNDEQTSYTITLEMMPRIGFNASEPGNFFYTGPTDPNAA